MKKLSFLLALVLIFSSIAVVPVFADTEYICAGDTNANASNTFAKYSDASSGLTSDVNVAGPLKMSGDVVYHVYGTSAVADTNWWRYAFGQAFTSNADFSNKNTYTYSTDLYFPTTADETTKSEVVICAGVSGKTEGSTSTTSKAMNLLFRTGEYAEGDDCYNNATAIFYGFEKDKWYNITVNTSFDGANLTLNIYVNGEQPAEHYRWTSSKGSYPVSGATVKPSAFTTPLKTWYFVARNTLKYVIGEKHDFYFDNVIYKAGATYTGDTKATIESAVDGVVTVETDVTLDGIKALATSANAVEIYRANAQAATGYDAITENFATGDIVKLVTANGSYSYYTLNVEEGEEPPVEPENPFVIGDLTSDLDVSDGSVSASIELTGDKADKDVTLVVCLYKGITFIEMKTDSVLTGDDPKTLSASISVPEGENYTAKAFVWDSLEGMTMLK